MKYLKAIVELVRLIRALATKPPRDEPPLKDQDKLE